MRFLITTPVPGWVRHPLDDQFVTFVPEPVNPAQIRHLLTENPPFDIWLANGPEVEEAHLEEWRRRNPDTSLGILVHDPVSLRVIRPWSDLHRIAVAPFPVFSNGKEAKRLEGMMEAAENLYARGLAGEAMAQICSEPAGRNHIALVGAGIVNLVCAEYLVSRGFEVEVFDAGPDPRFCRDWQKLGVTSGGGNARMYTRTEADNYNEKGSEIYQNMRAIFRTSVLDGGWCVKHPDSFSPEEEDWVSTFESTPPWLARIFSKNIFEINRESGLLWEEWRSAHPELFSSVTFCPDILRMYVEPHAVDAAKALHRELGAMVQDDNREGFLRSFPVFEDAATLGEFAGGFCVQGFTLNIHPFVKGLIKRIEKLGGTFHWNSRIHEILRDDEGRVAGLRGDQGTIRADHYLLSPGVGGNEMLRGTLSENLLQGTLGTWLQIPNLEPKLKNSIKIHRRGHLVEDINITVAVDDSTGEDILIFGGGYGYSGLDRPDPDCPDLTALFAELEEVARIYFPKAYEKAKSDGTLFPRGERRFCIRPFTPTGLGVFEVVPASEGGSLIITGGHNTGGFAQAPAIARAVWRALNGIEDPMHTWFHPARAGLNMHLRRKRQEQPS